jgi:adenine-specific DNA-methyltransferase
VNIYFTYMGTKFRIADEVADVVASQAQGPVLDLFAGISALGRALVSERPIWCNDIQQFSFNLTAALFTSTRDARLSKQQMDACRDLFEMNFDALAQIFQDTLEAEDKAITTGDEEALRGICQKLVYACEHEPSVSLRSELRKTPDKFPFRLFATTYAGGFIALRQSIEIDSIRYAIDKLAATGDIDLEQRRWLIIGLCYSLFRISNSTGHFAQYLTVKSNNGYRFFLNRRRSTWDIWRSAINSLMPLGKAEWRATNRAFCEEATSLLRDLSQRSEHPAVIYADPPYTGDQYSRYYHLLETLILYDYPEIASKGQYRADRYSSRFSMRTSVQSAFADLVSAAAKLASTIVISYPEKGLLDEPRDFLTGLLRSHYRKSGVAAQISHEHSSLGASKGRERSAVTEILYFGTP